MRSSVRAGLGVPCALGLVAALVIAGASTGSSSSSSGSARARPAASRPHSASFYARARRAAEAALRHALHPNIPARRRAATVVGNLTKANSFNWSGYADSSTTAGFFTAVSGNWTVPAVTCSSEDRVMSNWVGLDGLTNGTVEQAGTVSQCFQKVPVYYTWYEMFPAGTVLGGSTVKAGDSISGSVTRSGTSYTLKVTDSTTAGNNVNTVQSCAAATCLDESAEWITERPSFSIGTTPLSQFKTPFSATASAVTGGGTVGNPHTFSTETELSMIDATQTYLLATPTSLVGNTAFTVHWHNSY
jgi:hypothetical protein